MHGPWQHGLRAIECLDLALLVHAQNHGLQWRIQVQPDDIAHLVHKKWIGGELKGLLPAAAIRKYARSATRLSATSPSRGPSCACLSRARGYVGANWKVTAPLVFTFAVLLWARAQSRTARRVAGYRCEPIGYQSRRILVLEADGGLRDHGLGARHRRLRGRLPGRGQFRRRSHQHRPNQLTGRGNRSTQDVLKTRHTCRRGSATGDRPVQ